jgi:hypothetical protein
MKKATQLTEEGVLAYVIKDQRAFRKIGEIVSQHIE